jgi:glycerophosphoryl diester phosphodiesterase
MNYAPENTLASFAQALKLGAEAIEMDVQLSSDDHLVIFHDADLERVTGISGSVQKTSWRRIRELDAGAWFHRRFKGERVPLFEEVLARFKESSLRFVVELKPQDSPFRGRQMARAVSATIDRFRLASRSFVISFAHEYLPEVTAPVRKGILFSKRLEHPAASAWKVGADSLFPRIDLVTQILMREARENGLGVFAWTANSKREYAGLIWLGVDGITTNSPDKLSRVLGR